MATYQRRFEGWLRAALVLALAAAAIWSGAQTATARAQGATAGTTKLGPSGLPLPRFVSLKSDRVNVRKGPSKEHPVAWVFSRAGLPVEVIAEFENWRRVRDSEGSEGWVFHSLLSGRRTALVMPWVKDKQSVALYAKQSQGSAIAARLEPGVLCNILECNGSWCELTINGHTGWMQQERLWGVYRDEAVK